ncbi:hypothetical protein FRC08_003767 [Ceratobasidium sp. 394]|nr:hypothetical protein FRC08_003767 [Ceratobasidium sp. 394]KAG9090698.1 hypothetical protein FS749_000351 [Ceratobasidium sp. UAMH 11750]
MYIYGPTSHANQSPLAVFCLLTPKSTFDPSITRLPDKFYAEISGSPTPPTPTLALPFCSSSPKAFLLSPLELCCVSGAQPCRAMSTPSMPDVGVAMSTNASQSAVAAEFA